MSINTCGAARADAAISRRDSSGSRNCVIARGTLNFIGGHFIPPERVRKLIIPDRAWRSNDLAQYVTMCYESHVFRAFIGIDIPENIRATIATAQRRLSREPIQVKVSWTKIENLHLTLQFLGSVDESLIGKLRDALGRVGAKHEPFELPVSGTGAFPSVNRPKVLWVGCDDARGKLGALVRDVQAELRPLGFVPEQREFAAHLTLGRVKFPRADAALTRALDYINKESFGVLPVEVIHLFQSQLHPEGSIYAKLSSQRLTGATNHVVKS